MTHANAQCAIYIDFECLATKQRHPALLGVLVGAGAEEFEQVITDERLAPGRVAARKTSRIATAADAVGEVVARAKAENRMLVGWSLFDRDRLVQARPDLEGEIKAKNPNALKVAKPWRHNLYPDFAIERGDRYAATHTLDKYAGPRGLSRRPASSRRAGKVDPAHAAPASIDGRRILVYRRRRRNATGTGCSPTTATTASRSGTSSSKPVERWSPGGHTSRHGSAWTTAPGASASGPGPTAQG